MLRQNHHKTIHLLSVNYKVLDFQGNFFIKVGITLLYHANIQFKSLVQDIHT